MSTCGNFTSLIENLNKVIKGERLELRKNAPRLESQLVHDNRSVKVAIKHERDTRIEGHNHTDMRFKLEREALLKRNEKLLDQLAHYKRKYSSIVIHNSELERRRKELLDDICGLNDNLKLWKSRCDQSEAKRLLLEAKISELEEKNERISVKLRDSSRDRDRIIRLKKNFETQDRRLIDALNKELDDFKVIVAKKDDEIARLRFSKFVLESVINCKRETENCIAMDETVYSSNSKVPNESVIHIVGNKFVARENPTLPVDDECHSDCRAKDIMSPVLERNCEDMASLDLIKRESGECDSSSAESLCFESPKCEFNADEPDETVSNTQNSPVGFNDKSLDIKPFIQRVKIQGEKLESKCVTVAESVNIKMERNN